MGTHILKKIFLDTSPLIYYLSEDSNFKAQMDKIFFSISGQVEEVVISTVTCSEYLVYPYRQKDEKAVMALYEFINTVNATVLDIDMKTAQKAAKIRAEYKHFKSMDALQLAAAIIGGCDVFLTNDKQLKQFKELECITVEEWSFDNATERKKF